MTIEIRDLQKFIKIRRLGILNEISELAKSAISGKMTPKEAALKSVSLDGAQQELDKVAEEFGISDTKINWK